MAFRVVVRSGPRVERVSEEGLEAAIEVLERRCREVSRGATRAPTTIYRRTFSPVEQVVARAEVIGPRTPRPRIRGGVDVRGDGSEEAWTGRVRREPVERAVGESAYDALRRALSIDNRGP